MQDKKQAKTVKGRYVNAKKRNTQDRIPRATDVPAIKRSKKVYT